MTSVSGLNPAEAIIVSVNCMVASEHTRSAMPITLQQTAQLTALQPVLLPGVGIHKGSHNRGHPAKKISTGACQESLALHPASNT